MTRPSSSAACSASRDIARKASSASRMSKRMLLSTAVTTFLHRKGAVDGGIVGRAAQLLHDLVGRFAGLEDAGHLVEAFADRLLRLDGDQAAALLEEVQLRAGVDAEPLAQLLRDHHLAAYRNRALERFHTSRVRILTFFSSPRELLVEESGVLASARRMGDQFPRPFGNYTLLEPLAQGGMGSLYLAFRGELGMEKLCVVKTVLREMADAEYARRFRDEAKVVVRLSHGNLVPVFDAGTDPRTGELYVAMEFIDGKDLRAVWNRCAKKSIAFPVDVAVHLTRELARGLHHAHTAGDLKLVHRDVSPPNVLLAFSGEVK